MGYRISIAILLQILYEVHKFWHVTMHMMRYHFDQLFTTNIYYLYPFSLAFRNRIRVLCFLYFSGSVLRALSRILSLQFSTERNSQLITLGSIWLVHRNKRLVVESLVNQ